MWTVTLFFWSDALLYFLRVHTVFHRLLFKAPMLWVTIAILVIFPLRLLIDGIRGVRKNRATSLGWLNAIGGSVCLVTVVIVIGVPMLTDAMAPKIPKNPSTPRPVAIQAGLPVFPGAEGFGTQTPGGRHGKVIAVTALSDSGPGSLRAALEEQSPRIVVFRIGGTVELEGPLFINHPNITVAGQTAPGGGICLKNAGLIITTHDVLIQHIRVRPGNQGHVEPDDNDAIALLGKHGNVSGAFNVVLDHISASWAEDETVSTWFGAHDITISNCIISEALNRSRHHKHTHSAGLLIGDSSYHVSVHHSLLAHNDFRNPLIIDGGTHDIVNNVIYDWGVLPAEIVDNDSNTFLNFMGNRFIPGPSTERGPYEILINPNEKQTVPKIYVSGNIGPHRLVHADDEWSMVGYGFGAEGVAPPIYKSERKFQTPTITAQDADVALETVLNGAGATRPIRDPIDQRIVGEVRARNGFIIDSPEQVGGYPELSVGSALPDTDADGIPDLWEQKAGLDSGDPADANEDPDGDGYTNIEEFFHSLSADDS